MIKDVLKAIVGGKASRKEDLAAKVGMDPSAVEGALDFLVQREYLKVTDSTQPEGCDCGHCGKQSCCASVNKTYIVTEKGKLLAGGNARPGP